MMRRRTERPVERLRPSLTSTADLEETIAAMFHMPPDMLSGATGVSSDTKTNCNNGLELHPQDTLIVKAPDMLTGAPTDMLTVGPQDNMTGASTDMLTVGPPDNLTGARADNLTGGSLHLADILIVKAPDILTVDPPDTLTGPPTDTLVPARPEKLDNDIRENAPPNNLTGPLYQTLDGVVVDAKCIRLYDTVQNAHTASEHLVYITMWKMLGTRDDHEPSREGILPMVAVANKVSISLRNLRRVLRSLEQKLAVEITEYEDKMRSIPRRYRVWGFGPTMERRRGAGYHYTYRNRNLITLARPYDSKVNSSAKARDSFSSQPPDKLTGGGATVSLSGPPPDNKDTKPPDNMSANINKKITTTSSSKIRPNSTQAAPSQQSQAKTTPSMLVEVPSQILQALDKVATFIDQQAAWMLWHQCREKAPDCTPDEVVNFIESKGKIALNGRIQNPVGFLLTAVPRCMEGEPFVNFRRDQQRRREEERKRNEQAAALERIAKQEAETYHKAKHILESLPPEHYQALYAAAKKAVEQQFPQFITSAPKTINDLMEQHMIEQLLTKEQSKAN